MNLKIKFRESFRPFAPIVLRERRARVLRDAARQESPYMLLVAPVRHDKRARPATADQERHGLDKLKRCRSRFPPSRTSIIPPASRRSTRTATAAAPSC